MARILHVNASLFCYGLSAEWLLHFIVINQADDMKQAIVWNGTRHSILLVPLYSDSLTGCIYNLYLYFDKPKFLK